MTHRHPSNEAVCPVPMDILAMLLRSDRTRTSEIATSLPIPQRAALAAFCFSRCHMRALGLEIATHCDGRSLQAAAGSAGEMLYQQSRSRSRGDGEPISKWKVSLARVAA